MYRMHSLKEKTDNMIGDSMPSFSLSQEQIPEAKSWEVGKKYKLEIEVEMTGTNKDEYSMNKQITHRFKIVRIAVEEEDSAKKGYK